MALGASAITYVVVENPIRHAKALLRVRWASVGLGVALVVATSAVITAESDVEAASINNLGSKSASSVVTGHADLQTVLRLVAASESDQEGTVEPRPLVCPSSSVERHRTSGSRRQAVDVFCSLHQSTVPACTFGDSTGSHTMILYGDSHAAMWFVALDEIASQGALEARRPHKGLLPCITASNSSPRNAYRMGLL